MCSLTNVFGARQGNVPCVDVKDGDRWKPPPPTPEQMQQVQATEEAKEAAELKDALRASEKLIFNSQRVEYCMEHLSQYGHGDLNLISTACGGDSVEQCIKHVSLEKHLDGDPDPIVAARAECERAHADNQAATK